MKQDNNILDLSHKLMHNNSNEHIWLSDIIGEVIAEY